MIEGMHTNDDEKSEEHVEAPLRGRPWERRHPCLSARYARKRQAGMPALPGAPAAPIARQLASQHHCVLGLPIEKHGLTEPAFNRFKRPPVLFEHGDRLSAVDSDSPLRAFSKVDGRFDFSGKGLRRGFCRDADLLRPDEQADGLARLDAVWLRRDSRIADTDDR